MHDPNAGSANEGRPGNGGNTPFAADEAIVQRIDELVAEEHRLERDHLGTGLAAEDRARMRAIEVQLDQAWDLLRQRRARRDAGLDPDQAETRAETVVEHYQQ